MKISIITITYNSEKFISSCLDSLSSQTYKNIEHIIIDGKSSDNTIEIINNHHWKPTKFISELDSGIYDALNKGIVIASGDIIGFLHSDDFFSEKNTLERIANTFKTKDADVIYGDLEYVSLENPEKSIRLWESCDFKHSLLEKGWMPPHPTLFVRNEVYREIGPFDTNLKISGDYKSILKIFSRKSLKPIYLPFIFVKMRVGGVSNKCLKNIIRKSYEDFLALRSVKYRFVEAIYALIYKNLSKIKQFF